MEAMNKLSVFKILDKNHNKYKYNCELIIMVFQEKALGDSQVGSGGKGLLM